MFHLLLAHDLTARSEIALIRAARLALEREGQLTIVHVIDADLPAPAIDAQRRYAQEHLELEVRRLLGRDKPPHRLEIVSGEPAEGIAAHAESLSIDLVVAGRHRRRMIADMFIGTTIERLLRQVHRPVLVVNNSDQSPYRNVLIPVEFSDVTAAAIRFAAVFLPQAHFHLLHAYKGPLQDYVAALSLTFSREERAKFAGPIGEQAKQAMTRLIEALGLEARRPLVTIKNDDALALIQQELAKQKTDLLVMGTHAWSGLDRLLVGSVTDAVLRSSKYDILVVPGHRSPDRDSGRG